MKKDHIKTGSEIIEKRIRKHGRKSTLIGLTIVFLGATMIVDSLKDGWSLALLMLLIMGYPIYYGAKRLITGVPDMICPRKSWGVKRNPELFQMADQLYSNIVYEDKYILLSSQVIASKKNPDQMTWIQDVYWVYEHIVYINRGTLKDEWILQGRFPKNRIIINLNDMAYKKAQKCEDILKQIFPNAVYGYTDKGREYLNYMRQRNGY